MFNNYRKFGKFDIGSDIQNTTFSEKLDKNNWTQKNGLSHPGIEDEEANPGWVQLRYFYVGTHKSVFFSKKVVAWFEKLGLLCVAADTKSWSLASRNAAIPP